MSIRKITVGIDGSASALNALRWALQFAENVDASVTALGAWSYPVVSMLPEIASSLPSDDFFEEETRRAVDEAISASGSNVRVAIPAVEKGTAREVLELAAQRSDLLVVGRTGKSLISRVLVGSTAAWCAHHCDCSVAIIPPEPLPNGARVSTGPRLLVGLDGSDTAQAALAWTLNAGLRDASITAGFVFDPAQLRDFGVNHDRLDHFREVSVAGLNTQVARGAEASGSGEDVEQNIDRLLVEGPPREMLMDTASEFDVLVIGDRSSTGLMGGRLGSVADYAIRHCPVPVIVAR